MLIYKDIITDHELLSDVYPIKDIGDGLWEVDLANVTVGGEDFVLEGANASAEGEDAGEGVDGDKQTVLNLQRDFKLQKYEVDKKGYTAEIKKYMKAVTEKMKASGSSDDDIKTFQKGAQAGVKRILGAFKDYDLYINEDYDPTGMLIAVNYREDGVTPFAIVWKYGFTEYKV